MRFALLDIAKPTMIDGVFGWGPGELGNPSALWQQTSTAASRIERRNSNLLKFPQSQAISASSHVSQRNVACEVLADR